MNYRLLVAFVVGAAIGAMLVSCGRQPQQAVNAQSTTKAQNWEYKVIDTQGVGGFEKDQETFNKLGADGWECCGGSTNAPGVVFKRPKR